MVDVFISYKREDRARAERIYKRLQALGLDVWFDARIPSGVAFEQEIEGALRSAAAVLVLWTRGAVASDWVRNEATEGKNRGVLVALMLEPCELPLAFRSVHFEPLFDASFSEDHPSWAKILERIKDLSKKREQVERAAKRQIIRQKRNAVFAWLAIWPLGLVLATAFAGAVVNSNEVRPQLSSFYADSWDRGYFAASGTWELEGDVLAAPINQVELTCRRDEGYCLEARAEIFKRNGILSVGADVRPIVSWDSRGIATKNDTTCGAYVMMISRVTESVTALEIRDKAASRSPALVPCDLLTARKEFRLVNGGQRAIDESIARGRWHLAIWTAALVCWSGFVGWKVFRHMRRRIV